MPCLTSQFATRGPPDTCLVRRVRMAMLLSKPSKTSWLSILHVVGALSSQWRTRRGADWVAALSSCWPPALLLPPAESTAEGVLRATAWADGERNSMQSYTEVWQPSLSQPGKASLGRGGTGQRRLTVQSWRGGARCEGLQL